MICIKCGGKTKTTDARDTSGLSSYRRRRECLVCKLRFTTYEVEQSVLTEAMTAKEELAMIRSLIGGVKE